MINDIYTRTPINKISSLVVNQSGCSDAISIDDRRDSLIRAKDSIQRELDALPKKHRHRNELGQRIHEIQNELTLLRKQRKVCGAKDRDLNSFILDVIKESVPDYKFKEWLSIARARKDDFILASKKDNK